MSLLVWLPLVRDLSNQGIDNATFSIVSSSTAINNDGKLGKCYNNNSHSTGGLISNKTLSLGQQQSMFCWFKFTDLEASSSLGGGLVSQHRYASNAGMGITIRYASSTTGYLSVNTGTGSGRTYNTYYGTTLLQANTWYHGGYTYDGSTLKIYVNGNCEKIQAISGMSVPADYITVFCWSMSGTSGSTVHGDYKFNGNINDVRVYNHCLSIKEIKELSKGLIAHYPLNGNGRSGDNIVPGTSSNEVTYTYPSSSYSDKWAATTSIVPSASQYILSFYAKSTVDGDKVRAHWYSPNTTTRCETNQGTVTTASDGNIDFTLSTQWKKYWCIYTQSSTTAVKHLIFPRMWNGHGTGTVSVKCVKLEEGTKVTPWMPNSNDSNYSLMGYNLTTEFDISGNGYNGSKIGTLAYNYDTIRYTSSTSFNGTDNGVLIENLPLSNIINSDITYSFWVKPNGENGARSVYFGSYSSTSWSIEKTTGNLLRLYWNGSPDETCSGASITDGSWQHICVTKSGTNNVKAYINGVQKWSSSANHNALSFPTTYRIGRDTRSGDGTPYKGLMSDFRIYATALSADAVKELYQMGASMANNKALLCYEFNEI